MISDPIKISIFFFRINFLFVSILDRRIDNLLTNMELLFQFSLSLLLKSESIFSNFQCVIFSALLV